METLQQWEIDALLVDDLLDFSCGDIGEGEGDDCVVSCTRENESLRGSAAMCANLRPSQGPSEAGDCLYNAPAQEAELEWEWLSSFVEESYKGADNSMPLASSDEWFSRGGRKEGCFITTAGGDGKKPTSWLRMGASSQIIDVGCSPLIDAPNASSCWPRSERSRSKRSSRSGGRVWSLQRLMQSTTAQGDDDDDQEASSLDYEPYPPCKKAKKANTCNNAMQEGRRCSHCQVQKTPQWRAGPLGPKTLCNACGVRYKSGRLLPEYRPAASPTFISALHSNSHKKVLEMRTFKSCVAQELDQDEFSSCSQESVTSLHQ